jgi:hypothetical protein
MKSIDSIRDIAREMTLDEFRGEYPHSVLVSRQIVGGRLSDRRWFSAGMPYGGDMPDRPRNRYDTLIHVPADEVVTGDNESDTMQNREFDRPRYVALIKTDYTPEDDPISIGRTAKSDVMINDYTVSKVHANFWFDVPSRRQYVLDVGSTNGTWVGDKKLKACRRKALKSGDWVSFGRMTFEFMEPSGFYDYLMSLDGLSAAELGQGADTPLAGITEREISAESFIHSEAD